MAPGQGTSRKGEVRLPPEPPEASSSRRSTRAKGDGPRWGGAGAVWPVRLGGEESDRAGTAIKPATSVCTPCGVECNTYATGRRQLDRKETGKGPFRSRPSTLCHTRKEFCYE
ncbi:hypothetical protein JCM9957A_34540 [Kineosporia succinea]